MIRQVVLPAALRKKIEAEARAKLPAECCGLIEGTRRFEAIVVDAVHPTKNLAQQKDRFEIDPADHFRLLHAARGKGNEIVGCYHSHPNGSPHPSGVDAEYAQEDDFIWLIGAVSHGSFDLA